MTLCATCNGKGSLDSLENEPCRFCGGTGKYSTREDNEAISMLDAASVKREANAGDIARAADYLSMAKRRV